jgi:hypothetical protein
MSQELLLVPNNDSEAEGARAVKNEELSQIPSQLLDLRPNTLKAGTSL